jgi:hypothetical protein
MRILIVTVILLISHISFSQQQILIDSTNLKIEGNLVGEYTMYAQDHSIYGTTKNYLAKVGDITTITQVKYIGKNEEPLSVIVYKLNSKMLEAAVAVEKTKIADKFVASEEAFQIKLVSNDNNIQQTYIELGIDNPINQTTNSITLTFDMEFLADLYMNTLKNNDSNTASK